MSDKEKMLTQQYHISWDQELVAEREKAKDALFEFNGMKPSMRKERNEFIRKLFNSVGKNSWIESPLIRCKNTA